MAVPSYSALADLDVKAIAHRLFEHQETLSSLAITRGEISIPEPMATYERVSGPSKIR